MTTITRQHRKVSETRFLVEGMHCASCVSKVEKSLGRVPGVTEATVNLATREARVIGVGDDADVAALQGWRRDIFGADALALKAGELALAVRGGRIVLAPASTTEATD